MNEKSIEQVKKILEDEDYDRDHIGVYEGDADYYITCKIAEHYLTATTIEKFEEVGLKIHSFECLNGKYGQNLEFALSGNLKSYCDDV